MGRAAVQAGGRSAVRQPSSTFDCERRHGCDLGFDGDGVPQIANACSRDGADRSEGYGCEPATAECVPCPLERAYRGTDCCVLSNKPMVSMKGEWFHQRGEPMAAEGGHAVNIVGYSDTYTTELGHVGGYILRNTWKDGLGVGHGLKARGSHTARFFLQETSAPGVA